MSSGKSKASRVSSRRTASPRHFPKQETSLVSPDPRSTQTRKFTSTDQPPVLPPCSSFDTFEIQAKDKQVISPVELYPTPPPSPDLGDLPGIPIHSLIASDTDSDTPVQLSETFVERKTPPSPGVSTKQQQYRTTPAIPISLLLNTPHALPHCAPFKLTHPSGILSVLGGNRVLQLEGGSIFDRMPYTSANTNGVVFNENQGEEDSVEAMLGGKDRPMSPDQERISSIFVHPPTPDRNFTHHDSLPGTSTLSVHEDMSRSTSGEASPRGSPAASPSGSPRVGIKTSSNTMALPLQVLPEVRSPPRRALEMTTDSLRIAQQRGRRPKLFGFTELPDSSGSSAASSRNPSPERPSMLVTQSQDATSSSMGPATSSPGNFLPRRSPIRARSETSLSTIIHSATSPTPPTYTPSTLSQASGPPVASTSFDDSRPSHHGRRNTGLKLDFTGIIPLNASSSSSGPQSASIPSPYSARLIRKKSGEILKPALKYGGPLAANGTPLEAPPKPEAQTSRARFASKSAPTTPSCPKYVHFDSQLERVKLFDGEQKPSVVSRSGSPTAGEYTTSEGEEYPFPSTDDEGDRRDKKVLQIKLPNFPTSQPSESELFLESLFLDDDRKSLRGVIQVKNISFQKWVAVRFTLDWWQTTSEVTATHKDSVRNGTYDRFSFVIKLNDLLSKIEEKTLFLAIRYNTDGREIWDSNDGHNYQVLFEKVKPAPKRLVPKRNSLSIQPGMGKAIGGRTSQWSVTNGDNDDRLADLRAKLDRLHADDEGLSPPSLSPASTRHTSFSPQRRPISFGGPSGSPRRTVSALDARHESNDLPAAGSGLAARYDFTSALQGARRNSISPNRNNVDLPEVRTGLLRYGQNLPADSGRPTMDFYSPRTEYASLPAGGAGFFSPPAASQPLAGNSTGSASSSATVTPGPSTTPQPPVTQMVVPNLKVQGPSPEPSPSAEEPTASGSTSNNVSPPSLEPSGSGTDDTPSESPKSPPDAVIGNWSPTSDAVAESHDMGNYASFIEQFCWGGGAPAPARQASTSSQLERPSFERRAHSTSSLDAYFHQSTNTQAESHTAGTPSGNRPGSSNYFSVTPSASQLHSPTQSQPQSHTGQGHSRSISNSSTPPGSYFSSFSSNQSQSGETMERNPSSSGNSAIGLDFGNGKGALELNMSSRSSMSPPEVY